MFFFHNKGSPANQPIIWAGKPHFPRVVFTEVTLVVLGYWAFWAIILAIFKENVSDPVIGTSTLLVAATTALFSLKHLRHKYFLTRRHIIVQSGKKVNQFSLALINKTEVKRNFRMTSFFGSFLEISMIAPQSLKGKESLTGKQNLTTIRLDYLEDPFLAKSIIDMWSKSVKTGRLKD